MTCDTRLTCSRALVLSYYDDCASTLFIFTLCSKDIAAADEMFKRALEVDSMDAGITGSYVEFLEKHLEADYR